MLLPTLLAAVTAASTLAGPLNPPAGAIAPTAKPLAEIEPRRAIGPGFPGDAVSVFVITEPGSYYLAAPVSGTAGKHGISIHASNVTLDLNGFDVVGVAGSLTGIRTSFAPTNLTVRNGTIRNWGAEGLLALNTVGVRIVDVVSRDNGAGGFISGARSSYTRCQAAANGYNGFGSGAGTTFTHCSAVDNGAHGYLSGEN
ncbi:MAG TPA: hypothetical protein VFF65_09505, partial [Phycisphaerales bacterium]|nr:hypothetical protein [Phycisphaerales bacterium]